MKIVASEARWYTSSESEMLTKVQYLWLAITGRKSEVDTDASLIGVDEYLRHHMQLALENLMTQTS